MIGTEVKFYVRPGQEIKGTVITVTQQSNGDYPILTITSPEGRFTRPADEVTREVTIALHMDIPVVETELNEWGKDLAHSVSTWHGKVVDWEILGGKD